MADYYAILSRAVATLASNTAESRAELYARAKRMLLDDTHAHPARWNEASIQAEQSRLEAAIERIESETALLERVASREQPDLRAPATRSASHPIAASSMQPPRRGGYQWTMILGAAALLAGGLGSYLYFAGQQPHKPDDGAKQNAVQIQDAKRSSRIEIDPEEVAPGTDGGSNSDGLPYYYRRQLVYYRSVYTPGMIVIDRSQRFLYLVEPQIRALRYGIGIGGECSISTGLRRITRVVEWPEWRPSPSLLKQKSYPKEVAGGPGNPLGARAAYFEGDEIGIHGTNAPKSIGQALTLGCIRMVNDDVTDLVKRTAPGAGVIVIN